MHVGDASLLMQYVWSIYDNYTKLHEGDDIKFL